MFSTCLGGSSAGSPAKDMQLRLSGDSKLTVGVNGCLSLYVGPVIRWRPVGGEPHLSPNVSWEHGSSSPCCKR